jgi:hypothetical protein
VSLCSKICVPFGLGQITHHSPVTFLDQLHLVVRGSAPHWQRKCCFYGTRRHGHVGVLGQTASVPENAQCCLSSSLTLPTIEVGTRF